MSRSGACPVVAWLVGACLGSALGCGGAPPGDMAGSGAASSGGVGGGDGTGGAGGAGTGSGGGAPLAGNLDAVDAQGCPALLTEGELRDYALDVAPDEWAKLDAEFHDLQALVMNTAPKTYHPAIFHLGNESIAAAVRLKGQSSWFDTVTYDKNPKMQFVVSFDQDKRSAMDKLDGG